MAIAIQSITATPEKKTLPTQVKVTVVLKSNRNEFAKITYSDESDWIDFVEPKGKIHTPQFSVGKSPVTIVQHIAIKRDPSAPAQGNAAIRVIVKHVNANGKVLMEDFEAPTFVVK